MAASQEFPSKVDAWLALVMVGSIVSIIAMGIYFREVSSIGSSVCFGCAVGIASIIMVTAFPCRYVLEQDSLFIQAGIMKQRIPYRKITRVELSSNPRSAPALSLQRVKISFGNSFQLVSPKQREGFVKALQDRLDGEL